MLSLHFLGIGFPGLCAPFALVSSRSGILPSYEAYSAGEVYSARLLLEKATCSGLANDPVCKVKPKHRMPDDAAVNFFACFPKALKTISTCSGSATINGTRT